MKTLLSICILSLLLGAAARADDTAVSEVDSTYFHPAAGLYIQGDTTSASNLVAQGLSLYPNDGKLKRLKELIDQQQKQDQQNKDNQQNKEQQNQDQNKDQEKQDKKNEDQQKKQDQKKNQDQQNQDQQNQQEQQQSQPQPSTEQMSEDEAKQLLDAMKQEEKNKRLQLHPVMGAPVKVDKDW